MFAALFARNSLRTQIALLFGSLVAATAVLMALGFGEWIQRDSQREAGRALQLIASNAARTLADGLHERAVQTRVLAAAEPVWRKGLESPEVQSMLMRVQARQQHTAWVGMADTQGKVRAATKGLLVGQSVAARPWFQKGLEGPFVGDVHKALLLERLLERPPGAEPARFVDFSAPVRVDGRLVGVVGMHGSWEWTGEVIESLVASDAARAGLEVFVFDRAGELIYAPRERMQTLAQAGQRAAVLDPANERAQVVDWLDGERALSARVQLPARDSVSDLGWQVVARQPIAQAYARSSGLRQRDAALTLVLAAAVLVGRLADFVALEEQHLGAALASVDLGGQWRGVAELQRHVAFPLGLERRHVDDDAAARIGALAQADGEHVARDAEVLDRARQREAVGRDDADLASMSTKLFSSKFFGSTTVLWMLVNTLNSGAQRMS
jgi:hypothetical protein